MQSIQYFTICARNYLAYALTLRKSVLDNIPNASFTIFLADDRVDDPETAEKTISVRDLDIPDLEDIAYRYTLLEFATAIKPDCFEYLFSQTSCDAAVYLDPDIYVYSRLVAVESALQNGASIVLTPHILEPYLDQRRPNDIDILRSGTFNLGFAAIANNEEGRNFISWWAKSTHQHGYNDLNNGLFVDQKFMEFAPSFVENFQTIRDRGYNVAYWNLQNRPISRRVDDWFAGSSKLAFFHFSGVKPNDFDVFSKHQDRFSVENIGLARDLLNEYLEELNRNNAGEWEKIPYAFDHHDDGSRIPPIIRRHPDEAATPRQWFANPRESYWNEPSPYTDQDDGIITRLMYAIYLSRPDLQKAFPLSLRKGRREFRTWFIRNGKTEAFASDEAIERVMSSTSFSEKLLIGLKNLKPKARR